MPLCLTKAPLSEGVCRSGGLQVRH